MIEALFPEGVMVVRANEAMEQEPLHPEEAAHTARMAPKRLREFTLGRACVRRGLARLGVVDFPFLNDADRAPIWPPDVVGSLTHCRGLCAAVMARRGAIESVGLDAEPLRALERGVLERITSPRERAHLAQLPHVAHAGGWGLLLFSAKEAFYKCYYPLTRTFLGFRDAQVEIEPPGQSFRVRLLREDAPAAAGARHFEGRYAIDGQHLITAVTLMSR